MTEKILPSRLLALDVLRGLTIAAMIVVNNTGGVVGHDEERIPITFLD